MFAQFLGFLQARQTGDASIPSVCYAICENAYTAAQSLGKTPALCESGSSFLTAYNSCNECIAANGGSGAISTQQYLEQEFSQYVDYCNAAVATEVSPTIPISYLTVIPTLTPTLGGFSQLSGGFKTMSVWISVNITSTLPAYFTHLSIDALISSYLPPDVLSDLAASVGAAASAASVTGDPTSLIYSALEGASRPPWFTSAVPVTYAAQMSTLEADINALRATTGSSSVVSPTISSTPAPEKAAPSSKAWIAGVVVGVVVGLALLLMGAFFLQRHRRRRLHREVHEADGQISELKYGRHQLHGDSMAPANNPIFEMDNGEPRPRELPVIENPQELHDHRGDADDREANASS